jgi:hypothetical protein
MNPALGAPLSLPGAREIPREPEARSLSELDIAEIGRTVFVPSRPARSDLIFVFGSAEGRWDLVAALFREHYSPVILTTGGTGCDESPQASTSTSHS